MTKRVRSTRWHQRLQWTGLCLGPCVAVAMYMGLPSVYHGGDGQIRAFSPEGRATLSVMAWMATWWLTEAIDIIATALLPLTLFPLAGVAGMREAAAPYADPMIFLFLGGFFLAQAMSRWSLDRRIALTTLCWVGTRPDRMVAGFMLATAGLSAFVSNTATAAMMLPIAISVIRLTVSASTNAASEDESHDLTNVYATPFSTCLMLGIAYSASIGGIITIIGTPPNVFLTGFLRDGIAEPYRIELSFVRWLPIGLSLAVILLPVTWWLLTRILFRLEKTAIDGGQRVIRELLEEMGSLNRGECVTLSLFLLTAAAWISRPLLVRWTIDWNGTTFLPFANLTDPGIVMCTATCLFVVPIDVRSRTFALDWKTAERVPWGALILFGGGLSLAVACRQTGVVEFLGSLSIYAAGFPDWLLILSVTTCVIFLTELTSNLATVATVLPVLAALAPGLGVHPYLLIIPAAIAASCAFMLPVATPPNAIVFASGRVQMSDMVRGGFWLNLLAILIVSLITYSVARPIFGV